MLLGKYAGRGLCVLANTSKRVHCKRMQRFLQAVQDSECRTFWKYFITYPQRVFSAVLLPAVATQQCGPLAMLHHLAMVCFSNVHAQSRMFYFLLVSAAQTSARLSPSHTQAEKEYFSFDLSLKLICTCVFVFLLVIVVCGLC